MTRNGNSVDFSAIAYWRYVVGVLVALFAIPALLQGGIAFFRAFFDTLMTMLLAVNVVAFGAIAAGVGVFLWQRDRQLSSTADQPPQVEANPIDSPQLHSQGNPEVQPPLQSQPFHSPQFIAATPQENPAKFNATVELTFPQERVNPAADSTSHAPQLHSPLIQAQLARRLNVSSSTIGKRKHKPDFTDWAQSKDPDHVSWRYCEDSKQFYAQHQPT
ncbi:hypothetical protein NEA10_02110 [Phormidium yuhuli AB48]|uniref:Uncharacterized protein n=1 Tax=Phormidium yuhuli AB48 TaxID=2940671 RepID=A0ABY5AQQ1_9CYAN|nr:hypothetical protein [Phormidium yuhuli]USR91545.1 hypothetical protein NEA10_02110 [Phormidium yuhuli AB48]